MTIDISTGSDGNDDIKGMSGADVLLGDAGDDRICGDGPAADTTLADYTAGERQASDFIYGGADNDKIWGGDRDPVNTPNALNGNDYLDGEDGLCGGGRFHDRLAALVSANRTFRNVA
jgi:Ca2+-binding RTX toxin-like protein